MTTYSLSRLARLPSPYENATTVLCACTCDTCSLGYAGSWRLRRQRSQGGKIVPQNCQVWRGTTVPDYPDSRIFIFCRSRVSSEMTDSEVKVGLAFHGISCIGAFALLL